MSPKRGFGRSIVVAAVAGIGLLGTLPAIGADRPGLGHGAVVADAWATGDTRGPGAPLPALAMRMLSLVNATRDRHHLSPLEAHAGLSRHALRHSRRMAAAGDLSHTPDLGALIRRFGGEIFGENVASGRGLRWIRLEWLRHPSTRANVLDPRFERAGIGVALVGRLYWVTFWPYA